MPDDHTSPRFAELIGPVTPLKDKAQHPGFAPQRPASASLPRRRQAAQGARTAPRARGEVVCFNFDNIPAERFLAMQRGELPFARILDLHGYYVAEALTLLDDALYQRQNRRREIWLIIHGKGRNSPTHDRAPLKQGVVDLLCQHPAVAALCSLHDSDRESGALCIDVHIGPSPRHARKPNPNKS